MKPVLATLALIAATLIAAPAQAVLSDAQAGQLAELAFRATYKLDHSPMDAAAATRHGNPRFVWFRTNFFLGETADGSASFAVDRHTGAVWIVGYKTCAAVDAPELAALRAALHLRHPASVFPRANCRR